ncbi:DUF92 domain-containing protein [candidate division KSB1 bacterium]|nr:DUF92 domain-containing protein [candidate division KSB1 bacterium]
MEKIPLSDWIAFGGLLSGLFVFVGAAEKIRSRLGWPGEVTRKLVHVLVGVLVFSTPFFIQSPIPLYILAIIFIVVNFTTTKFGLLKGMHDTERVTYGTTYYPIAFLFLVLFFWKDYKVVLMAAMLILALGDAAATLVGKNIRGAHIYYFSKAKKSVEGSSTLFLLTVIITLLCLHYLGYIDGLKIHFPEALWIAVLTAIGAVVIEALSGYGLDNLFTPLGAAFITHFMIVHGPVTNLYFTLGMIFALVVVIISIRAKFLELGGAAATFLLGWAIFGIGGWSWALPILVFFFLSSIISKLGKNKKKEYEGLFAKSSRRDLGQVLANGGAAGLLMLGWNFFSNDLFYLLYLGTLAAVTADTWGTEVGLWIGGQPRSILSFKQLPKGASGGITLRGTLGAAVGAGLIALTGYGLRPDLIGIRIGTFIALSGLLASLVDSVLGITIQAQYECPVCQKLTERARHCGDRVTELKSGFPWIDNDMVNWGCALSGIFLMWLLV